MVWSAAGLAESATAPPAVSASSPPSDPGTVSGLFDIGERELFIECIGEGSPTVILEPGQGDPRSQFDSIQSRLAERTTVCTYDRANTGASGPAATPRTSADVVSDLRALLAAADLEGPYVLVGTSAGALFALHYARLHPDDVVGVLAMNPPPVASEWVARAYPLLSDTEVAGEEAFYRGDNPESFDWTTSSEQIEATLAPADVPLILLHSTATQCEGEVGACSKTADLYVELGEEYAAAWPGARFEAVDVTHAIHLADEERVVAIIAELVAGQIDQIVDTESDVAIVGSWHRAQSCQEMLAVFDAAGVAQSHLGWLQGNFFGGAPGPTVGDVCEGALGPLEHEHFFTDSGEFGSHNEHGQQVDNGDYELVDDDTLVFPSHATEFGYNGDLSVNYEITDDVVTFDVVLPDECEDTCKDAYAWALSAFASGPWTRGEVLT